MSADVEDLEGGKNDIKPKATSKRFRFKHQREKSRSETDEPSTKQNNGHKHHHSSRHHRSKRKRTSYHLDDDSKLYDESVSSLPPAQAFRESLFDAMADDEGASFWQDVYGQPIHNYPREYQDEETGELEQLNDEEYASYVRKKMWEKSWEGIEALKEEKRRAREEEKQEMRKERGEKDEGTAYNNFVFDFELDASLHRGQRRKQRKHWQSLWQDYTNSWEQLQSLVRNRATDSTDAEQLFLRNKLPWPVESGKRKDVNAKEIQQFFEQAAESLRDDGNGAVLVALLKVERVRWHPDKVQQRFGFMDIDESTSKSVTAVFQVIDQLWNEVREKT